MKKHLCECGFSSGTDILADVSSWLEEQGSNFYLARISSLPANWISCVNSREIVLKKLKNNNVDYRII